MLNKFVIVVPCFNEEKRFNENYFNKMVSIRDTFWIFVDDGSTDPTGEILKKFCNKKNTFNGSNLILYGPWDTIL